MSASGKASFLLYNLKGGGREGQRKTFEEEEKEKKKKKRGET